MIDLAKIVGKAVTSNEFLEFESLIGEAPRKDPPLRDDRVHWTYAQRKLEILIDSKSNRVGTVFIAPSGVSSAVDGLRYPLSFGMSRDAVRKAIGRAPDAYKDDLTYDVWEEGEHKLRVEYVADFSAITLIVLMAA
jgi:hypothetical protein